jgi:predicted nucleotidyltransferase
MNTKQSSDLGAVFFGAYRRRVLGLLLLHPDEAFHLREIARITDTQPGTLRRELLQLTQAGVFTCEKMGNLVRYRADKACPIYAELRGILKKTAGVVDVLREALAPLSDGISAAFVYGSVASGAERRASDIDVMVVGRVTFEQVTAALHGAFDALRREVNASVYSEAEFNQRSREKGQFLARVMKEPVLMILGNEHDLKKPGENRQAETA